MLKEGVPPSFTPTDSSCWGECCPEWKRTGEESGAQGRRMSICEAPGHKATTSLSRNSAQEEKDIINLAFSHAYPTRTLLTRGKESGHQSWTAWGCPTKRPNRGLRDLLSQYPPSLALSGQVCHLLARATWRESFSMCVDVCEADLCVCLCVYVGDVERCAAFSSELPTIMASSPGATNRSEGGLWFSSPRSRPQQFFCGLVSVAPWCAPFLGPGDVFLEGVLPASRGFLSVSACYAGVFPLPFPQIILPLHGSGPVPCSRRCPQPQLVCPLSGGPDSPPPSDKGWLAGLPMGGSEGNLLLAQGTVGSKPGYPLMKAQVAGPGKGRGET